MSTPRPAAQERIRVSVIIPAHNEEKVLGLCLDSLARMDYPAQCFEVIVVDNGSTDRTKEVAESFAPRLNLKVLEKEGKISAVRNCGARTARGEIFAFTDADCEVPKDWLTRGTTLCTSPKTGIVGAHGLIPENSSWVARHWYGGVAANKQGEVSYVPALDLLVPRSVFFKVGGFDESIQTNEDFEFCQRVRAAGYVIQGHPEIAVVHLGTPQSFRAFFRKQRWHGTHVFRVFLRNISKLHNARAVFFALYTLLSLAGMAAGAAVSAWTGRYRLLALSLGALVLVPFLLSLRMSLGRKSLRPLLPLTVLHVAYGIARAICLLEVSKWWGSWKNGTRSGKPVSSAKATAAKTSPLGQ